MATDNFMVEYADHITVVIVKQNIHDLQKNLNHVVCCSSLEEHALDLTTEKTENVLII